VAPSIGVRDGSVCSMASADGVLSWLVLLWLLAFASAVWSTDGWYVDVMAMAAGCDDGVDDGSAATAAAATASNAAQTSIFDHADKRCCHSLFWIIHFSRIDCLAIPAVVHTGCMLVVLSWCCSCYFPMLAHKRSIKQLSDRL